MHHRFACGGKLPSMSTRAPGGRKGWSGWSSTLISWGEGVDVMVFIMQGFGVMNEARKHEGLDVRRRVRTREAESARSQARECALTGPRVRAHFPTPPHTSVGMLPLRPFSTPKPSSSDCHHYIYNKGGRTTAQTAACAGASDDKK